VVPVPLLVPVEVEVVPVPVPAGSWPVRPCARETSTGFKLRLLITDCTILVTSVRRASKCTVAETFSMVRLKGREERDSEKQWKPQR
jgi:hypothetical protein